MYQRICVRVPNVGPRIRIYHKFLTPCPLTSYFSFISPFSFLIFFLFSHFTFHIFSTRLHWLIFSTLPQGGGVYFQIGIYIPPQKIGGTGDIVTASLLLFCKLGFFCTRSISKFSFGRNFLSTED
jgi:hypothetical protein